MLFNAESCPIGSQSSSVASIGDTVTLTCSMGYRALPITYFNPRSVVPQLHWSPGANTPPTNCSDSNTTCSSLSVNITSTKDSVQSCSMSFLSAVSDQTQCTSWKSSITVPCTYFAAHGCCCGDVCLCVTLMYCVSKRLIPPSCDHHQIVAQPF